MENGNMVRGTEEELIGMLMVIVMMDIGNVV